MFFNFVTDKYRNGEVTPENVSLALGAGQLALFKEYYNGGQLVDVSVDALLPFAKTTMIVSNVVGIASLPNDYYHLRALIATSGVQFSPMEHAEISQAVNSQLLPIAQYPRYLAGVNNLQLYPQLLSAATLYYYSKPIDPIIAYMAPTDDYSDPTYNATNSVQIGFAKQYWIEVIMKSLPYIGVNLGDSDVLALGGQFSNQSQQSRG